MSKYNYKSEIKDINPLAHRYNILIRKYNKMLKKYESIKQYPMTKSKQYKATRIIVKLSIINQKIDDISHLLESEYS